MESVIFKDWEIEALMDGRKTQFRRPVKEKFDTLPVCVADGVPIWDAPTNYNGETQFNEYRGKPCPYGKPGDAVYVKETWVMIYPSVIDGPYVEEIEGWSGKLPKELPNGWYISYQTEQNWPESREERGFNWIPSMQMPEWASRFRLKIEGVGVERLQDITEAGAREEGVKPEDCPYLNSDGSGPMLVSGFNNLWDRANSSKGKSFTSNPYVWVITFKLLNK